MRRERRLRQHAGVCLTEMMIAMVAGTIVLSATVHSFQHFQQRLSAQHEAADRMQDQRIGMQILQSELRLARPAFASDPSFLMVAPQEVEFWANLEGLTTDLTQAVTSLDTVLPVSEGTGWRKGKRVVVCAAEVCADGKLAKDGRRAGLTLSLPLGHALPRGSAVTVTNRVRYYLGRDAEGVPTLMRQVDGGANPIIGHIEYFELRYVDRLGRATLDPAQVTRIHVELAVGSGGQRISSDVAIHGQ